MKAFNQVIEVFEEKGIFYRNHLILYAILFFSHLGFISGQTDNQGIHRFELTRVETAISDAVIDTLKKSIPAIMKRDSIPGVSVVVVSNDTILWIDSFGYTDKMQRTSITESSLFSIQSISKSITTLAILVAVQEGILDLDVPINKYLPDFKFNSPYEQHPEMRITIRHLLSHQASLPHEAPVGNNFDNGNHSFQQHINSISGLWLRYPVGYHFAYSNLGVDLAGYILEKQSGIPFEVFVEQKVLLPIGMNLSTFSMNRIRQDPTHAIGHVPGIDSISEEIPMIPSGGLYSNATEMANYLRFHLNKGMFNRQQIIQPEILEEMYRVAFPELNQLYGYCLGLWKQKIGNTYQFFHSGYGYGFASSIFVFPELHFGVAVLTNSEMPGLGASSIRRMIEPIISAGYQKKELIDHSIAGDDSTLLQINSTEVQSILGRYGPAWNAKILEVKENKLVMFSGDQWYPAEVHYRNGRIQGNFGGDSDFSFLSDLNENQGTLVIKTKSSEQLDYFDYNDGPNDKIGPASHEWDQYLGKYQMIYYNQVYGPLIAEIKNGYLYFDDQRCIEIKPGLFYLSDGGTLDFRDAIPKLSNINLFKISE
jgi:CubicO group peptidase (beta-lactamase class C family)